MIEWAISTYTEVLKIALPIGIVYAIGDLMVGTFMRSAFGGKLWFGK